MSFRFNENFYSLFYTLSFLLFIIFNPLNSQAQPPENNFEFEEMVVVGRGEDLTGIADSASEGKVGQLQLRTRPILRSGEILEVIPGMIATQHSGTGKANQYFLRGFNLDHGTDFAAKVDGMPINHPTHGHGQGYLDLNFIIPELVDFVQFKKGPYYAEVGDFSSAGAADIRMFDAIEEGFIEIGIGEDDFFRIVGAESLKLGEGTLLGGFETQFYDGPWKDPEDLEKYNGMLKYSLGDDTRGLQLSAMGYYSEWDSTDQIPRNAVTRGLVDRLGSLDPSDGGDTERYSLSLSAWNEHRYGLTRGTFYVAYYDFNLWSNFEYFLGDSVNGDQFQQVDERIILGGELTNDWSSEVKDYPVDHSIGLQFRHDFINEIGLHNTRQRKRLSTVRDDEVDETSIGLFYENTIQWHDYFRSIAGLRGDAYFFDVTSKNIPQNSGTENDQILSPKLSLVFGPIHKTEFYVSAGLGYHSNDARGTTIEIDPDSGDPVAKVDPLVRSRGTEIGLRSTLIPGYHSTLALWYLELDSELVFVGDAGTTEPSGESERIGLEWTNYYKITNWLTLDFDVAYVDAKFSDAPSNQDEIPNAVPLTIATGASVKFDNGLFGSIRVRHLDRYPLEESGTIESDATTLVNLQIGYEIESRGLGIHVDILNLFDSDDNDITYFYASRPLATDPPEGIEDIHFHPVEPRTIRVYLSKKF